MVYVDIIILAVAVFLLGLTSISHSRTIVKLSQRIRELEKESNVL